MMDQTLALLADPYRFISQHCRIRGADAFETRLLLQRTVCMSGPRAAEVFYNPERFMRRGAPPEAMQATLLGRGSLQGLDGEAHRQRKRLFMAMMAQEHVDTLVRHVQTGWERCSVEWQRHDQLALYEAVQPVLTRAVCDWVGVPLPAEDLALRTRQLVSLFDDAAPNSPRHLRARWSRHRAQHWLIPLIRDVRSGRFNADGTWLRSFAMLRDFHGRLLPPRVAVAELLNVLRPTVAVSVFIVFAAHALHLNPPWRFLLARGDEPHLDCFVQEVRRFYPFFPMAVARARDDFMWEGLRIKKGQRALLDLYGTNHDPRSWPNAEEFRPARFLQSKPTSFEFVPQGGGNPHLGHRCAGEGITVAIMKSALRFLSSLDYDVAKQDLNLDMQRLPALPRSHFVMSHVRQATDRWVVASVYQSMRLGNHSL